MKSSYSCSQASLYATNRLVWQMIKDNQATFFAFDPIYTEGYIAENFALTKTVEQMADANARKEAVALLSLEYDKKVEAIVVLGKYLKSYIERSFSDETQSIMLNSAGFDAFNNVKKGNANAVSSFMSSAVPFVVDKTDILTTKGRMSADFLTQLKAADAAFEDVLSRYNAAVATAKAKTDEKLIANNDLFARLQQALADGRTINIENPDAAKAFQFSTLLAKVDATKNAGINGKTTIGGGKKGLADVTVTEPISGKTYVSEKDGFFEITPLTEGKYTLVFSIEGYETQTITSNDVKTGVMKRLNVEMVPMAKPQVKG